jgi:UDP-N-acetyl-2-amino-2-deoxyglucuronate dehydrogenase
LSRRLRVGIVGCGKVAGIHAEALTTLADAHLAGVCDFDRARAEHFASKYEAEPFADVSSMIQTAGVEAVIICTPHPIHASPTIAAAEAGAHVLVEKPLAASLEDCDAMIAACAHNNVKLGIVSQRRYFEPVLRMKQAIDQGKIGAPILGEVVMLSWRDESYYRSDPWRGSWKTEGGGVLINQSPHHIDILQWLMGPVVEVTGYWANLNHPTVEVEDTATAVLRFASGGLASVVVSLCQKPGIYTKIHVHGSNGASVGAQTDGGATFIAGMSNVIEPPVNDLWTIPGEEPLLAAFQAEDKQRFNDIDPTVHYHRVQDHDFIRAILDDREPTITGHDGRKVVELISAIYRSNNEGRPIKLPLMI